MSRRVAIVDQIVRNKLRFVDLEPKARAVRHGNETSFEQFERLGEVIFACGDVAASFLDDVIGCGCGQMKARNE
jgi:hypothetical protein